MRQQGRGWSDLLMLNGIKHVTFRVLAHAPPSFLSCIHFSFSSQCARLLKNAKSSNLSNLNKVFFLAATSLCIKTNSKSLFTPFFGCHPIRSGSGVTESPRGEGWGGRGRRMGGASDFHRRPTQWLLSLLCGV